MALLGIRFVVGAATLNAFRYATEVQASPGDAFNLDFQFVDLGQLRAEDGYNPPGLRYCPAAGAAVAVTFKNLVATRVFTRSATQPYYPGDSSIWRVPVLSTDPLSGTVDLAVKLVEGGSIKTVTAAAGLLFYGAGGCGC